MGEFTASLIIAEIGDINRFKNIKELTVYCGLDPSIKQSGKSINIKGLISKSGNKYLRKILFVSILNILSVTRVYHIENDIETYYRKKVIKEKIITLQQLHVQLNFFDKFLYCANN